VFRGLLHVGTVFFGSLLLFLIQPMMGKLLLPRFGGAAGVWTTAMLFFQAALLLGYLYAHWSTRLAPAAQTALHVALLAASCLALPVVPWSNAAPAADAAPEGQIVALLAASIGLPFCLLSSTSPLVQSWRSRDKESPRVYRLFAVSNLASLAALVLYPVIVEPLLGVRRQLLLWSIGYACFAALAAAAALASRAAPAKPRAPEPAPEIALTQRLLWIALAACPSALWLAMANTLSQNVAPVPLLWVLPLAVYLLTLVLAFDGERWYRPAIFRAALPAAWLVMAYGLIRRTPWVGIKWHIALSLAGLGVCCLFCHGELARRKPPCGGLTSFYVDLALGGALGGVFVALAAPRLFDQFLEFPVSVAACVVLAMALVYGFRARRVARLAVLCTAAVVFAAQVNDWQDGTRLRRRNFYGALQVSDTGTGDTALRILGSGAVLHGSQFAGDTPGRRATTYYGPASGVARAIRCLEDRPVRAALIGLGAGTLAACARAGDFYRFYELNPEVIDLARRQFRYLNQSAGHVEVVPGDGRLALARETGAPYDLIVLDAFSGDSIPTHLLTREAFALYCAHLAPNGILAVNITNRYVDLEGVVRGEAAAYGRGALVVASPADPELATRPAVWVLITANRSALAQLEPAAASPTARPRLWTDEYSDLFGVLR
jgi:hypothetical protein